MQTFYLASFIKTHLAFFLLWSHGLLLQNCCIKIIDKYLIYHDEQMRLGNDIYQTNWHNNTNIERGQGNQRNSTACRGIIIICKQTKPWRQLWKSVTTGTLLLLLLLEGVGRRFSYTCEPCFDSECQRYILINYTNTFYRIKTRPHFGYRSSNSISSLLSSDILITWNG